VYQVSFENVEWFLSYEVRFKFLGDDDDADADDDDKVITITRLFFFENRQAKNVLINMIDKEK